LRRPAPRRKGFVRRIKRDEVRAFFLGTFVGQLALAVLGNAAYELIKDWFGR
jgi:hypothetical protein